MSMGLMARSNRCMTNDPEELSKILDTAQWGARGSNPEPTG
jgi:hypothetical protein